MAHDVGAACHDVGRKTRDTHSGDTMRRWRLERRRTIRTALITIAGLLALVWALSAIAAVVVVVALVSILHG